MTESELASVLKNCVAVLLVPLSLIVVLLCNLTSQLVFLSGEGGMLVALAAAVGIVLLISAVGYLAVGLRTYFPLVELPDNEGS